jgi:hypothetical protein
MYGDPIHVPPDAGVEDCERLRARVESEITQLEEKALRRVR